MDEKENKDLESIKEPEDQPEVSESVAEEGQAPVQDPEASVQEDSFIPQVHEGEAMALISEQDSEAEAESEGEAEAPQSGGGGNGNKVWQIVSLVLAVLLIAAVIIPLVSGKKVEAVATVNGEEITKDQLYDEMSVGGANEQALDKLITMKLIDQEAKKQNIVYPDTEIDKEIEKYVENFGSQENLEQALASSAMTMEDLRENIRMNELLTQLLEPQVKVTDEQIKQTFEDNKASFDTPEQVRTSVILVQTEDEAKEIIKELKDGKDFAELAKSKSLDEATKANGGDTDFFARGQVEEAVENAAFKLAKDEISSPVKTEAGYQVIKLTDRKEAHTATLEEKKEEIRKGLVSQQVGQLTGTWIEEIRSKADIKNTLTDKAEASTTDTNTAE
ncbi:peptidylprolyl isomerase [Paenibacillus vini]|uniref:peptidylprolyl isomerase n=1 Tax=Paenibacillus vini TaxID=1476024 RepID=A0ABQ4MG98_9BACL|nr:peptidylprolyl isomerase [Paenibacillus vini]GIP55022.1 hypothetical protein J42TS3_40570 [Paenibacillus vini]